MSEKISYHEIHLASVSELRHLCRNELEALKKVFHSCEQGVFFSLVSFFFGQAKKKVHTYSKKESILLVVKEVFITDLIVNGGYNLCNVPFF